MNSPSPSPLQGCQRTSGHHGAGREDRGGFGQLMAVDTRVTMTARTEKPQHLNAPPRHPAAVELDVNTSSVAALQRVLYNIFVLMFHIASSHEPDSYLTVHC